MEREEVEEIISQIEDEMRYIDSLYYEVVGFGLSARNGLTYDFEFAFQEHQDWKEYLTTYF